YRQEHQYQQRKSKAGDQFSYKTFEPTINAVVNVRVTVKGEEEVDVFRPQEKARVVPAKERLLRVETLPGQGLLEGKPVPLPSMVLWLDKDLLPQRSQLDLPELGRFTLYRSTREFATAPNGAGAKLPDLGLTSRVRLQREIPMPYETRNVLYRVTVD